MAPIYLGKMVVPSSLRYIENLASMTVVSHHEVHSKSMIPGYGAAGDKMKTRL